jgi:hypothetical protein
MKKHHFPIRFSLLLVFLVITTFSCQENTKKENSGSFYTIPFTDIIKHQREVKLSELANDVQFIPFDNNPEALLGRFRDIRMTKDYIFIAPRKGAAMEFTREGRFVRRIGTIGRGPGQYDLCIHLSVDEKNKRLYIQGNGTRNMLVYDFDGDLIKAVHHPKMNYVLDVWSRDSLFVSFWPPMEGNERYVFIEHDETGDTLQGIANHILWKRADNYYGFGGYSSQNSFYRFQNKLHMKGWYNDTVYTYDQSNRIVPEFNIAMGKHKLPDDLIIARKATRPLPPEVCAVGVHETSRYVFIPYEYYYDTFRDKPLKEEQGYVLYDKQTKEGSAVEETKQGGFVNDVTGGPDFRPTYTNDSTAVMLVSALDMKQYLESDAFKNQEVKFPERKKKLEELGKTLKEDDNTILVVAKIKS